MNVCKQKLGEVVGGNLQKISQQGASLHNSRHDDYDITKNSGKFEGGWNEEECAAGSVL